MKRSYRCHLPVFPQFRETQVFSTLTELPKNFEMLHLLPEGSSYLNLYFSPDKRVLNVGFLRVLQAGQRDYVVLSEPFTAQRHD